jgi:hypothetical protein
MLRARDNPSGQAISDAFDPDDKPLLLALCKDYEGETPTARQKILTHRIRWLLPLGSSLDLELGPVTTASLALQHSHAASGVITRSKTVQENQLQLCESDRLVCGGITVG